MPKKKKKNPSLGDEVYVAQDWSGLQPGQSVRVRAHDGSEFTATIEVKTQSSTAVWIIRDGPIRTRHVVGHSEGTEMFAVDGHLAPAL